SIEYFNFSTSLGKFFVPPGASAQPEFLGVLFNSPVVTGIQITVGTAQIFSFNGSNLTPGQADLTNDPAQGPDLADTDDFIYSEPVAPPAISQQRITAEVRCENRCKLRFSACETAGGNINTCLQQLQRCLANCSR